MSADEARRVAADTVNGTAVAHMYWSLALPEGSDLWHDPVSLATDSDGGTACRCRTAGATDAAERTNGWRDWRPHQGYRRPRPSNLKVVTGTAPAERADPPEGQRAEGSDSEREAITNLKLMSVPPTRGAALTGGPRARRRGRTHHHDSGSRGATGRRLGSHRLIGGSTDRTQAIGKANSGDGGQGREPGRPT